VASRSKGTVTMQAIAEKLDRVESAVSHTRDVVDELKATQREQQVHIKHLIGPPPLEERLRNYVDERDSHKQATAMQAILNVQTILQQDIKILKLELDKEIAQNRQATLQGDSSRERQHQDNQIRAEDHESRMRRMEKFMYLAVGALMLLELALKFLTKG
jgi:hypothetical protein